MSKFDWRNNNGEYVQYIRERNSIVADMVRYARGNELMDIMNEAIELFKGMSYWETVDITIDYKGDKLDCKVARGASKVVLIVENLIAIKTDVNVERFGKQTEKEANTYDRLFYTDVNKYLCPIFRYFKRQNISMTLAVQKVDAFDTILSELGEYDNSIEDMLYEHNIRDWQGHEGNGGKWNNKAFLIDYGF